LVLQISVSMLGRTNRLASLLGSRSIASTLQSRALSTSPLQASSSLFKSARSSIRRPAALLTAKQPVRFLNIHEYQSMDLMDSFGIAVPKTKVCSTPAEAETAAEEMGGDAIVKAQVLAGGRGKGTFLNGFQGGVRACNSSLEARGIAAKMLGQNLVTKQTGPEGKPCNKVTVNERLYLRRETYFAILMDRASNGPVMVASPYGGMNIEDVAAENPDAIFSEPIDIFKGVQDAQVKRLANAMGFTSPKSHEQAKAIMTRLYELFIKRDATQVEINPLAETHDGRVLCIDAKLNFDDNAVFRQKDLFAMRDESQMDTREVIADKNGLNYIGLDGSIGCVVNGAGLAMATMDIIKLSGGNPANFLDLGGAASADQVIEAFRLLQSDPNVKVILVNIFGGIMRCDVIALGLIKAVSELGVKKPLVVRLMGTNHEAGKKVIEDSGLRMLMADDLGDAAAKAVRICEILQLAEKADISVALNIGLN